MATAVKDPLVGRLVDGRYLVGDRIASGGMATVYLATDTRLERPVALKVMHAHLAADASFVARFTREARSAARLSHPGVVSVYDQGAGDGTVYLAMEHVPGRTLRDLVAEAAPLTLGEALEIIEEVLDGLAAAHAAGLVHRDVKPENVLVGDDGRLRVADFGLARAATTATGGATSTLIGTVGYLAPELVLEGASDERADVYAAGVVLYELLTGRAPFAGGAAAQVAYRHVSEDLPRVSSVRPGVPDGLDALVARSTDRDPERRPRDAGVMLEQVRALHDSLPDAVLDAAPVVLPDPSTVPVTRDGTRVQAREHIVALPVAELRDAAAAAGVVDGTDDGPTTTAAMPAVSTPTRAERRGAGVLGLPVDVDDEPAATRAERPRRGARRGVVVLVCSLLAVLVGGGAAAVWAFTAGPLARVVVPDVTPGTPEQAAVAAIERQGLGVSRSEAYSTTVPPGDVISTTPDAGERVEPDSTVSVVVSLGQQLIPVPDVVGATQAEAEAEITDAGLTVGTVSPGYSDTVPEGSVVSMQTQTQQPLLPGSTVSFTVSQGPAPIDLQPLEGLTLDDAEKAITDAGLIRGRVRTDFSDTVAREAVISETRPDGPLEKGDVIDLLVSDGPSEVTVPGVGGRTLDEARGAVEVLGLSVREERPLGFGDRVYQQYPSPGEVVEPGTTVVLTLGP